MPLGWPSWILLIRRWSWEEDKAKIYDGEWFMIFHDK